MQSFELFAQSMILWTQMGILHPKVLNLAKANERFFTHKFCIRLFNLVISHYHLTVNSMRDLRSFFTLLVSVILNFISIIVLLSQNYSIPSC